MPYPWDYLRPRPQSSGSFEPFNSRVTYYAPGPGDRMEGGFETSQPNPQTGRRVPSTLDDVRLGTSPFVTLAGDPSRYGQTVKMGPLTYTSPIDRKSYTLPDVTGYVHDTGSAFKGRPDKLDVATGDFRGWSPQQASALLTADAGRRTVTPLYGDDADREMRPIGLPEPWRATGAGENPPEATAIASGPPQGRKMPASLLDMFNPTDAAGGQASFGDALASRSNSLIGLGLGLLQPSNPLRGQSTWGNALEGFQSGSTADTRQAQLRQQTARDAYQRQQDALDRAFKERQFTQSTLTPYQKMQADLARVAGTPEEQQTRDFYRSQLDAGPPQTREVFDPTLGRNVVQEWDSRTKQYKTATMGGGGTPTAEQGGAPAAPGPGGPGPQPVLPPKKPLSAHEQSAIDAADKAVVANRGVIGTLQDAKRLSQTALSGPFTTQRAEIGAQIPDYAPGMNSNQRSKDTLLLNNAVISQAVEQLKATFGGNPSEGERKILLDLAGSVNSPHDVREKIYNNAIKAAQEKLDLNERQAREIRSGSYYNPGGGASAPRAAASAPSAAPNADAIRALKQNPQRRAEFDAKYGEGSAMRILRGE